MVAQNTLFSAWKTSKIALFEVFSVKTLLLKVVGIIILGYVVVTMNFTVQKILFMFGSLPSCWERYVQIFVVKKCFFDFINPAGSCHQEFMFFAGELSIVIGKLSRFYDLDSILLKYLMNVWRSSLECCFWFEKFDGAAVPLLMGYRFRFNCYLKIFDDFRSGCTVWCLRNERCFMFGLLRNLQALNPAIVNFDYYLPLTLCDLWIENVFKS